MTERFATIIGFGVASIIPPLYLAVLSLITESDIYGGGLSEMLIYLLTTFVILLPYSVLFMLLFGVPCFLLCRRLNRVTWWAAMAAGALVGVIVSVSVRSGNPPFTDALLKFVPAATLSALAFFVVWKRLSFRQPRSGA